MGRRRSRREGRERPSAAPVAGAAIVAVGMLGTWLLLAGASLHEVAVGAACACVAAAAWAVATASTGTAWRLVRLPLRSVARLPLQVVTDTARLLAILARHLLRAGRAPSLLVALPFDPGGADAASAMRRALVVAGRGATPGAVVVGVDPDRRAILVHRMDRRGLPPGATTREP